MTLTLQTIPQRGDTVLIHITAPGATEVTSDTLKAWLGAIKAELQAIPDFGAHLASLQGPYVPPTDQTAAWVGVPVERAVLTDEPFIMDVVVEQTIGRLRLLVTDRLQARRLVNATA